MRPTFVLEAGEIVNDLKRRSGKISYSTGKSRGTSGCVDVALQSMRPWPPERG